MEGDRLGKAVETFLFIQVNDSLFCLALSWVSEVCISSDLTQSKPYLEHIFKCVPRSGIYVFFRRWATTHVKGLCSSSHEA